MSGKIIIGLSGKKGSGKSTIARLLAEGPLAHLSVEERPMAGPLKSFCVDVLGLKASSVYGDDTAKNEPTRLLWEQAPNYGDLLNRLMGHPDVRIHPDEIDRWDAVQRLAPKGPMTVREVMQWVGADVLRTWDPHVWVHAWARGLMNSPSQVVFVTDVRFPNEVQAVKKAGGVVVRLLRNPYPGDEHVSETALDNYPLGEFSLVVDNSTQTPERTAREVAALIRLACPEAFPFA